ncbi:DUF4301 family protein [Candidatus Uabimicrobium amorphum]|uniref:DUF4301 domain-containing protein n=1 Tax=Uabimicrobium amorphum TaxID=2596890 RepID=A0A5S9IU32_UABAM|nr:DUF4301 family protein [Candidatus Uabimicrobium amorphum]BBM87954.1 hypothetical protein UABAM_06370 [Candidatus Uabimicrobium amorphum]
MLNSVDIQFLKQHNIDIDTAREQLERIKQSQRYLTLERACTHGDGITQINDSDLYIKLWQEACDKQNITKFVPASGAATRMFKELLAYIESPQNNSPQIQKFFQNLDKFAFYDQIPSHKHQKQIEVLQFLLTEEGLNYANLPKALLLFHKYPQPRLAFEEHLAEAVNYIKKDGHCRLHFTITEEHLPLFQNLIDSKMNTWEQRWNSHFDIRFSHQEHCTDSLSLNQQGELWRTENGKPLLRPAGHGALIHNLNNCDSDIIVLKNVDNVCPDSRKNDTYLWKKVLIGLLYDLQQQSFRFLEKLHANPDEQTIREAHNFAKNSLHIAHSQELSPTELIDFLNRPLRVCGVVPNTGEPGGGPFWVKEPHGCSCQIVEKVQILPEQQDIMQNASHFNPVDVVCGVKNFRGEKFDLHKYVNHDAFITVEKSHRGKYLKSIERPGLWNGSMHYWNTIFVEVPITTFTPVKTIFDLLREEHL